MRKCLQCNSENQSGAQYCYECGTRLSNAASQTGFNRSGKQLTANFVRQSGDLPQVEPLGLSALTSENKDNKLTGSSLSGNPTKTPSAVSDGQTTRTHARLIIERGDSTGKTYSLNADETLIGRWDADRGVFPEVDLDGTDPHAKVSRRHARILHRADDYQIEDLGSTNGTFVNRGHRLIPNKPQSLRDGDEIIVGKTFLRFYVVR